ncbi:MAG: RNA polymerase sigma factor [Candidatus Dormibacteraceae bacterium]
MSSAEGGRKAPATADSPSSQGDRFRSIFESRYPAIWSYVHRRVGSATDVADVTAQVFHVAWRRQSHLPEPPDDLPWLYGVARKLVYRHWRGSRRRQQLEARLAYEASVSESGSAHPNPEVLLLQSALTRLHSTDQEVLKLIHWEQLSHAEAGAVLGCSANAVGIRLLRARNRLRLQMERDTIRPTLATLPEDVRDRKDPTDGS